MSARKPLHPECTGSVLCTVQSHVVARTTARGLGFAHIPLTPGQRKTLRENRYSTTPERTITMPETPDLTERARVEALAKHLRDIHFDGTGCGTSGTGGCTNCFGPSPMSAHEIAEAALTWAAQQSAAAEGVQPGCTGADNCSAPAHLHGCYADLSGRCSEPGEHLTPVAAERVSVSAEAVERARMTADCDARQTTDEQEWCVAFLATLGVEVTR